MSYSYRKELRSLREQYDFEKIVLTVLEQLKVEFTFAYNLMKIIKSNIVISSLIYDVFDFFVKYLTRYIAFCPRKTQIGAAWSEKAFIESVS